MEHVFPIEYTYTPLSVKTYILVFSMGDHLVMLPVTVLCGSVCTHSIRKSSLD